MGVGFMVWGCESRNGTGHGSCCLGFRMASVGFKYRVLGSRACGGGFRAGTSTNRTWLHRLLYGIGLCKNIADGTTFQLLTLAHQGLQAPYVDASNPTNFW